MYGVNRLETPIHFFFVFQKFFRNSYFSINFEDVVGAELIYWFGRTKFYVHDARIIARKIVALKNGILSLNSGEFRGLQDIHRRNWRIEKWSVSLFRNQQVALPGERKWGKGLSLEFSEKIQILKYSRKKFRSRSVLGILFEFESR